MATDQVNIKIRRSHGPEFFHQTSLDSTVRKFKKAIAHKCGISPDQQHLIYGGRFLNDDRPLRSYGLDDGHVVHLVLRLAPDDSRIIATGGTNGTTNSTRIGGANEGGDLRASDLGLNVARGTFGSGLSNLQQMLQPFDLNPSLMRDQMNTPMQIVVNYTELMSNLQQAFEDLVVIRRDPNWPALTYQDPYNLSPNLMNTPAMQSVTNYLHTMWNLQETFEDLAGIIVDPAWFFSINQDPHMTQALRRIISNLRILNRIIDTNPVMRGMPDFIDHLRGLMQDPEFLARLSSPALFQRLLTYIQARLSHYGRQQSTMDSVQAGRAISVQYTPNSSAMMGTRMQMEMSNHGIRPGGMTVPNRFYNEPPERLYAAQLSQLEEMGFIDRLENIRALNATSGNVHAAVERLWRDQHSDF